MPKAIVVGAGAGGAAAALELQGRFQVTVLEDGAAYQPLHMSLATINRLKHSGLVFAARQIQVFYPAMRIDSLPDMVLVHGRGAGGSTTLSCGNGLLLDTDLRAIGIDISAEHAKLQRLVPITTNTRHLWREPTKQLYSVCADMGLDPQPVPKMGRYENCRNCGRCMLGCRHGVKWDSRELLQQAVAAGAEVVMGSRVLQVVHDGRKATGVVVRRGLRKQFVPADLVVLAAGGMGTPVVLAQSGLQCEKRFFVDPVLTVAAHWPKALQVHELPMPFMVQQDRYIISPYFDYLSYIFARHWRYPARDIYGLMIKLADEPVGAVTLKKVEKNLTPVDQHRLHAATDICRDILHRCGITPESTFLGLINAGHPGGSLPLTKREANTLHHEHLPANLYVADASLLPNALGAPNILTIMSLATKVAKAAAAAC